MQITEIQKRKYETRLQELEEKEPELKQVVKNAQELGDFSENSELDSAKSDLNENRMEQSSIKNTLANSEVVTYDTSNLIVIGSLVEVVCPALNDGKSTIFLVSDTGDCMLEGVINTATPLGKAIIGNVSGEFRVGNNVFSVTKITKPNLDEFILEYPSDQEVLNRFFNPNAEETDVEMPKEVINNNTGSSALDSQSGSPEIEIIVGDENNYQSPSDVIEVDSFRE